MSNKFISVMDAIGKDAKKALDFILPWAETAGEAAVSIYAPALGPTFNATVQAVVTAEANAVALGSAKGTGAQKLAAVTQIVGGLVKQGLTDAGKAADDAAVQNYINGVVTILNAAPAPAPAAAAA